MGGVSSSAVTGPMVLAHEARTIENITDNTALLKNILFEGLEQGLTVVYDLGDLGISGLHPIDVKDPLELGIKESGLLRIETIPEDADFLIVLNTFDEALESDAGAIRIDEIAVSSPPGAETGVHARVLNPTVVGPTEISAVTSRGGVPAKISGLCGSGVGEGVGTLRRAAGVESDPVALPISLSRK